uniref:Uncharacterized protein n=1 Tax=uncultured Alphaproteobacteria bacterium TaxID=91750 RepID=A0A6G8F248_9PROT|nr:hypothetical protein PlAlph_1180 [uncultured Alphaproteobacteria bacterium]
MKNTSQILHNYQKAGYEMILSSHHVPEKQDAVTEKIAYIGHGFKTYKYSNPLMNSKQP